MKRWKKNFRKVPIEIMSKLDMIESSDIVVGCAKQIPLSDIESGIYEHIGITANAGSISFEESLIPEKETGRYSKYNVNGREIVLKHLPMVSASYTAEVPNYGDWSNGSHDITWTRQVYQRDYYLPQLLNINIELIDQTNDLFTFKFSIDTILSKEDTNFEEDLLYHCNVLQENVGICDVFAADSTAEEYIETLYVDWELLPPGVRGASSAILGTIRNTSNIDKGDLEERIKFFETLNIRNYIRGRNRFSLYFGAILQNGLVILENVRYGNAIYVFKKDWEEFSKLSRTELINIHSSDIIRVQHTSNWKNNVTRAISEAS